MNLLAQQLRLSALQAQATRFTRFARDAPIGILFLNGDGSVQFANDEYLRIVGWTREDFEAERFRPGCGGFPQWLQPEIGARHEGEYVRRDGSRVPILVGLSRQEDGLAAFILDLTAEKAERRARQESEDRYRATAEKLAEADRRKEEFFGMLSHELRNPLAAVGNALHLLAVSPEDPARSARARGVIERQIGHLSRLVDDLLDATRISRGRVVLQRAPLDLAGLVRDTVEDHRSAFEAAGLELALELPPAPVPVDGDATRLAQVLGNLLSNSAKFTPRGGAVAVLLRSGPGVARLDVTDTGEGVEAHILPRLFEPFAQADRTLARSRGGLGLGLAVVKGLVELHGGEVAASSAGVGAGMHVVLHLPAAAAPATQATPPGALARPASERHAGARAAASVLIVEDNVDSAETLRDALELEGMSVTVAADGGAGIAAARRIRPDVIVCDIGLPGNLDGYAVAREIRADPGLHDTPLVALTGYASPEDRARARDAGFERHLAKPCGIDQLMRAVAELVGPMP